MKSKLFEGIFKFSAVILSEHLAIGLDPTVEGRTVRQIISCPFVSFGELAGLLWSQVGACHFAPRFSEEGWVTHSIVESYPRLLASIRADSMCEPRVSEDHISLFRQELVRLRICDSISFYQP